APGEGSSRRATRAGDQAAVVVAAAARPSPGRRPRMAAGGPMTIASPPFSVATRGDFPAAPDGPDPRRSPGRHRVTLSRSRLAFPDRPLPAGRSRQMANVDGLDLMRIGVGD